MGTVELQEAAHRQDGGVLRGVCLRADHQNTQVRRSKEHEGREALPDDSVATLTRIPV